MYNFTNLKKYLSIALVLTFVLVMILIFPGAKSKTDEDDSSCLLPIIMYHSLLKEESLQNDYTISPDLFEADLKFLTDNGYTTITVNDLVNYVYSKKPLPEKCVMLTFDDGYYNNYYYAYPLLKKYNCRAVISPIASVTQKFSESGEISVTYGNINADNIKEMTDSGLVEIQNHSYEMHRLTPRKGIEQRAGESDRVYEEIISADIKKAQEYLKSITAVTPNCFVYPFGAESKSSLDIVKKSGFVCTMTCTEKLNCITKDPNSLFELGRYRRRQDEDIKSLFERMSGK